MSWAGVFEDIVGEILKGVLELVLPSCFSGRRRVRAGNALTVLIPIRAGQRAALREVLLRYGEDIAGCRDIDFAGITTVHFLRFVIIDAARDGGASTLMFESNYDGPYVEHARELAKVGSAGLHAIFRHCVGYPLLHAPRAEDVSALAAYWSAHRVRNRAFHVAVHGQTAAQVRIEAEVRERLDEFLDDLRRQPGWPLRPWPLYEAIVDRLQREGLIDRLRAGAAGSPPVHWPRAIVGLGLAVLPYLVLLPLLPVLAWWLRHKERTEPEALPRIDPDAESLAAREDVVAQNQITHYVAVKPGSFRRRLLAFVLAGLNVIARNLYSQGTLGGIASIHFARWVLLDGGRQLLFSSNYDGSWESYLGDFIDKAAIGLSAVWSNTEGFPRTRWLVLEGARDEERFKSWTRAHQVETPLWYSAYSGLTVRNILHNQRICTGLLRRPVDSSALNAWLSGL